MKKFIQVTLCAAAVLTTLTACGGSKEEGKKELVVSTWGLSEDIVNKDVVKPFEEKFDCKVILETGGTNDRYTKLAQNPKSKVDVIELSQAAAAEGYVADLFEKIDYAKLPNAKDLINPASELTKSGYGPAHTINSIGIVYNPTELGFEIKEWADLWRPELKGKVSIPDITTTFGPAMMQVANDYKKGDMKADKGEAAFKALEELKPNIVKTYAKSSDLANMFASKEIAVAVVGDFGLPTIQQAQKDVKFVVPESGTYANFNTMDINKNSENKDLAYEYINWRISSELQTTTAKSLNESPTNSKVNLDEETAKNKTYGKVAENAKLLDYTLINPLLKEWTDKWNRTLNN